MAAERPKIAKGMPVSRANVVKNELRNYGKPFCPAFLMVGHDMFMYTLPGKEPRGPVFRRHARNATTNGFIKPNTRRYCAKHTKERNANGYYRYYCTYMLRVLRFYDCSRLRPLHSPCERLGSTESLTRGEEERESAL